MNITSLNRLTLLNKYVQLWLDMPRMNRAYVADRIVDTFYTLGFDEHLDGIGIRFCGGGDFEKDMRHNMQKVFRWLGKYQECKASASNLFYMEQVIVAAMPENIRISYLNEVYICSSVAITKKCPTKYERLDITEMVMKLIKEGSEAQVAALNLGANPTKEALINTLREVSESEAACAEIRRAITEHYQVPEMKNRQTSPAKNGQAVLANEHNNVQRIFEL